MATEVNLLHSYFMTFTYPSYNTKELLPPEESSPVTGDWVPH